MSGLSMSDVPFTFESVSLGTYLLIAAVAFGAAIMSGMSGFGSALVISIFLAPVIGIKAVVPVMSVVMLINNASRLWFYRHALDRRSALLFIATSVPASLIGAVIYSGLDVSQIGGVIGTVLILSVPLRRYLVRKNFVLGQCGQAACGATYGFLSATTLGAGIMLVPMLMGAGLLGQVLLATDAAIAIATNIVKIAIFGGYHLLTPALLLAGVLTGLCTVPGAWAASWVMKRTSVRIHTIAMEVLIVAGGLSFYWPIVKRLGWI